jgi:hypothetical protein
MKSKTVNGTIYFSVDYESGRITFYKRTDHYRRKAVVPLKLVQQYKAALSSYDAADAALGKAIAAYRDEYDRKHPRKLPYFMGCTSSAL